MIKSWRNFARIMVESDMNNQHQQVAEELCLIWNRTNLGAPFISGFCVSTL
jgi:hypothetical protein